MKTFIITLLTILSFNLIASDLYPLSVISVSSTQTFPSAKVTLKVFIGCSEEFAGTIQTMQGNTNVIGVLAKTKTVSNTPAICLAFQEKEFTFIVNTERSDNDILVLGEK